jgi:hypothetical protein
MQLFLGFLALLGIGAICATVLAVAIAAMRRGARHGSPVLGSAIQELESLFVESKRHVIHESRADDTEEEPGAGDPPVK